MKLVEGKVKIGFGLFDNPLDESFPRFKYKEWKETQKTSYRSIWLDYYEYKDNIPISYASIELKISNRNKVFLDDIEIKDTEEIESVKEIFNNLKFK